MLIDITYFTRGERQLMNASSKPVTSNENAVKDFVEGYIAALEEKYLLEMLGKDLCAILNVEEEVEVFASVKERLKESFADYVFYHILRDMNETPTITGIVRLKSANAYVSPIHRQTSVWNSMVDKHLVFLDWVSSDGCPFKVRISRNMITHINSMNL